MTPQTTDPTRATGEDKIVNEDAARTTISKS